MWMQWSLRAALSFQAIRWCQVFVRLLCPGILGRSGMVSDIFVQFVFEDVLAICLVPYVLSHVIEQV